MTNETPSFLDEYIERSKDTGIHGRAAREQMQTLVTYAVTDAYNKADLGTYHTTTPEQAAQQAFEQYGVHPDDSIVKPA